MTAVVYVLAAIGAMTVGILFLGLLGALIFRPRAELVPASEVVARHIAPCTCESHPSVVDIRERSRGLHPTGRGDAS